ncbi:MULTISPECIES: SRPBCC family protein [unclassified Streptomyces]|uniref:SRPBCC family protein n=1 Tax=unclassified Streptomyces TaxID=2593676 RepID=UPI001164DA16|nr:MULTISPECIES: SRPBCC family protein [unclassified Streptomyces]QDN54650.1 SRPBCC family protein [Streptomyces sp. S1D4-20]QDN64831.1 SRPBCC family protein [Streptomyces sp. S1D4-14]QDO47238.1 SRPBCC family protein [Streptomyces sp. RLB3-5]QDO57478.1 SRPBCC family protein [Streptomyces sp. RLB1-8]
MADKERDSGRGEGSGLDMLRDELSDFLGAQVEHLVDRAGEKLGDVTDQLLDTAENGGSGGSLLGIGGRILKGDSPLKAFVGEKAKGLKDNVMDKVKSVFGGGRGGKSGSTKVMNIIEVLDVGVPIRVAYNYWTQYEEFSDFTKGVRSVSRNDETASDWKVKVGPSTRGWKATVQEQVPDDRIVWSSEGAKGTTHGCVSFHELTPDLTRIVLVVEYYPSGFFEKTGNLWRAQGRRLRLDFKNFQRYVTFADEDVEGWRGEIRDGEVIRSHEEALEEEEAAGEGEEQEEYDEEAPDEETPEEEEEEEEYDEEGPEDEYAEEEEEEDEDEG